jgi:hypothetical protein
VGIQRIKGCSETEYRETEYREENLDDKKKFYLESQFGVPYR